MSAIATRRSAGFWSLADWAPAVSRYRAGEYLIVGLSVVLALAWIATDRTPPAWDQSRYLSDAFQYVQGFHHSGVSGVVNAFFEADTYYAPGYPAFIFPFELGLGLSVQSALIANLVLWVVLLLTVAALARLLFGEKAGVIALAVTATIPLLLVYLHQAMLDVPAATCASLAVYAMLRTSHFTKIVMSALAGIVVGIGLLTKATDVVFLAGPLLVIALRAVLRLRTAPPRKQLRVAGNMALATGVATAVAAPWYVTNWDTTMAYLQSATSGEGSRGMGAANPLDPGALLAFSVTIVNATSLALVAGIAVLGVIHLIQWVRSMRAGVPRSASRKRASRRWSWALLGAWTLVPLLLFATSHNQDPRQAMFVYPGLAIVFAGLVRATPWRPVRIATVASVLSICAAQALVAQLPPLNPVRDLAYLNVAVGPNTLAVFQPAFGVANPSGDDGTPVMRQLEAVAGGSSAHVLVAQEDHVFNPNTLTWLGETRQDRYTFEDPQTLTGDPTELTPYDIVIYMPAADVQQRNQEPRLLILNRTTATTVFGDELFTTFHGGRHRVILSDGDTVWVLQR